MLLSKIPVQELKFLFSVISIVFFPNFKGSLVFQIVLNHLNHWCLNRCFNIYKTIEYETFATTPFKKGKHTIYQ